jgi:hypothetical protein
MIIDDPLKWQAKKLANIYSKYTAEEIYELLCNMQRDLDQGVTSDVVAQKLAIALGR